MKAIPTLITKELILRPFVARDAPQTFAYASDLRVTQFTHWSPHSTIADTQRFIQYRTTSVWAIIDTSTHTLIGECGFIIKNKTDAEIHCALIPAMWGRGFATQALLKIIDFGFCSLPFAHIDAWIVTENVRSVRLAHNLAMQHYTTLPNHWYANGVLYDVAVYRLSK